MTRKIFSVLLDSIGVALVGLASGCSSGQGADLRESLGSTQAAANVTPPGRLAGNSNYWITAADPSGNMGKPITGLNVSIAVREDLHLPNGVSAQLNGWSAPDSNVVWQQYGFSITPPTLGWGIENWPTAAYGKQLGMPDGGSLNFPGSLAPSLPNFPYGKGIVPAGYVLDLIFHDDAKGNITGMTYAVTDICGKTSSIGPINIVGTTLAPSGAQGTIPATALAPMYGVQMNLVNQPGSMIEYTSGSGTISYSANEPLYVSNHQPSWTSAQGIVTGENSDIAYSQLSANPSKVIVQDFGLGECQCGGTACELPPGSYPGSCTNCKATQSGTGCKLSCDSCGTISNGPKANPSVQIPCGGALSNGAVSNNNGELQLQCTFAPKPDSGVQTAIDPKCAAGACTTPQGPYLKTCTGCAAVSASSGCTLGCTSCTQSDGTEHAASTLTLPCSKPIVNANGVLSCPNDSGSGGAGGQGGAQAAGNGGQGTQGGASGEPGGRTPGSGGSSPGTGGASGAGASGAATVGGGASQAGASSGGNGGDSSGCSCTLAGLRGESSTPSLVALALAGVIASRRRRRRPSV